MSLMRRRLPVGPVGTHGTATHVRLRWRDFNNDMKSHTAKTWCSINTTIAARVLRLAYSGWVVTPTRADLTAARRSTPGWVLPPPSHDMTSPVLLAPLLRTQLTHRSDLVSEVTRKSVSWPRHSAV